MHLGHVLEAELIALGVRGEGKRLIEGWCLGFCLELLTTWMMVSHIVMGKIGREII